MLQYKLISENVNSLVFEALFTEDFFYEYICKCVISVNKNDNSWIISQWYANKNYQHKGYGRLTMKYLVQELYNKYKPNNIIYIWNNVNEYVYNWIVNNFDAKLSDEAIRILKVTDEDVKEGHQYYLNKDKFLKYFEVR